MLITLVYTGIAVPSPHLPTPPPTPHVPSPPTLPHHLPPSHIASHHTAAIHMYMHAHLRLSAFIATVGPLPVVSLFPALLVPQGGVVNDTGRVVVGRMEAGSGAWGRGGGGGGEEREREREREREIMRAPKADQRLERLCSHIHWLGVYIQMFFHL